jgi:hypothetical protein
MTRVHDVGRLTAGAAMVLAAVTLAGCEPVDPSTTTTTTTPVETPETTTTVPDGSEVPRATPEERATAMALLGIAATPDVLAKSDWDLVLLFSQRAPWLLVRGEAHRALTGTEEDVVEFIRTGLRESIEAAKAREAELERIRPERTAAAAVVGVDIEAEPAFLHYEDRDFVFEIGMRAAVGSHVYDDAIAAWRGTAEDQTAFIKTGIFEAARLDEQDARDAAATAARIRAEREPAAALVGLSITDQPVLLRIEDKDFVFKLWEKATGPKVKAAAVAAYRGTAEDQHRFITVGIYEANRQDIQDAADAKAKAEADAKAAQELRDARIKAAAIVGFVPTEGQLLMWEPGFVLEIARHAEPCCPEVRWAALDALESEDPAVHRAFIFTGIHEAHQRDLDRAARGGRP